MFGFGSLSHILVVLILALIFIGPKQLPEVARSLGRMLNELRRTSNMFTSHINSQLNDRLDQTPPTPPAQTFVTPTVLPTVTPISALPTQAKESEPQAETLGEQLSLLDVNTSTENKKS